MYKIQFGDSPNLEHPEDYNKQLVTFISSCLIKDASKRPNIETLIKINKEFFNNAKNSQFLKSNLIKNLTNIIERVNNKYIIYF